MLRRCIREATADGTELRLLKALRTHCPNLPADLNLVETLAAVRRGQNSAAVDLFQRPHAVKVLEAFGRALGVLPAGNAELSKHQSAFLDQAVSGLAEDGKVICVRLALFVEMMKGKPWTPAMLRQVGGGMEGVGVAFLEETFSSKTAPPEHRHHQKAAKAVLKQLLPEQGSDIKGNMRSGAELLEASGYGNRADDFDNLLRILDTQLRLITPRPPAPRPRPPATNTINSRTTTSCRRCVSG